MSGEARRVELVPVSRSFDIAWLQVGLLGIVAGAGFAVGAGGLVLIGLLGWRIGIGGAP